jgi:outer membrane protein OmpA-like peptidoglycan-associated protein
MNIVRTLILATFLAFALAATAPAQNSAYPSDHPSPDQILNQLVPPNGAKTLHFRGTTADLEIGPEDDSPPRQALAVEFAANSAALSAQAKESIREIGAAIRADLAAGDRVLIEASPDDRGRAEDRALATKRALAVRDWLATQYAIEPKKLEIVGAGADAERGPAAPDGAPAHGVRIVRLGHGALQP